MEITRGYFDKTLGNGVVRITASADCVVTIMASNGEETTVPASIETPPSDYTSGSATSAPSNGMLFNVPAASSVVIGPLGLHANEVMTFYSGQRNLTVFVTVQADNLGAGVVMTE